MDSFINKIKEVIVDFISPIVDWIVNWMMEDILRPSINKCKMFGESMFNDLMNSSLTVLVKSPEEWNSSGWQYLLTTVNNAFVAFGCQLVVLFFLIGFFAEAVDPKHEIRFETVLKALMKILFAQYLVCNSAAIVSAFFDFVGDLTGGITTGGMRYALPAWTISVRNNIGNLYTFDELLLSLGLVDLIFTLVTAFIYMVVMIGAGAIIAYTAYTRFFKIMVIVPYGSLASATVAGNSTLNHTAVQFYKYVLSVVLEAVTMIVAIGLYTKIMGGAQFAVVSTTAANNYLMYAFINRSMAVLLLVGVVKGSGALTQRVLGL